MGNGKFTHADNTGNTLGPWIPHLRRNVSDIPVSLPWRIISERCSVSQSAAALITKVPGRQESSRHCHLTRGWGVGKAPLTSTLIRRQRDARKPCLCGQRPQSRARAGVRRKSAEVLCLEGQWRCVEQALWSHSAGKCCSLFDRGGVRLSSTKRNMRYSVNRHPTSHGNTLFPPPRLESIVKVYLAFWKWGSGRKKKNLYLFFLQSSFPMF